MMVELVCESKLTGAVSYRADDVIHFPRGLPGFDDENFLLLRVEAWEPMLLLQSIATSDVCLPLVPAKVAFPEGGERGVYTVNPSPDWLGPALGGHFPNTSELLILLTVRLTDDSPTVNLVGPVIVDTERRLGWQVVQDRMDSPVSARLAWGSTACSWSNGGLVNRFDWVLR